MNKRIPGDQLGSKSTRSRNAKAGRHGGNGPPKFYTIKAVAEASDVAPRTVRRWADSGALIVHRRDGVVRIADADLRAFWAQHREG